ncbi:glutamine synthetase family protein [Actinophytocola sp.]|uniref:glutamine synthetase family protein n=1 Tax=Actinophytocola sp. TaxID=1872138 RepID=UPI002ED44E8A
MTPEELRAAGVTLVELSFVDNAGITRVKTVPLERMPAAPGVSPCFDAFGADDVMVAGRYLGGPDGDLRLVPDTARLVALRAQPGWAWAPADRYEQSGTPFVACQRTFAQRQVAALAAHGLHALAAFEHEWVLGKADSADFVPAFDGPAYGQIRLEQVAAYAVDLVADLQAQGLSVQQFHPEYATAQLEVSVAENDPVSAADDAVLTRHTIRARSLAYGWRATFAPSVDPDGAGSGAHLHLSVHDGDHSLMSGGDGPFGLRTQGEAFLAGVLRELPALIAIGAGHPVSFLRAQPSRWAGIWQAWGHETRETALRFITGPSANAELKCFDATANPYLLIGCVIAAGIAGLEAAMRLPEPVTGDPATGDGSVPRLPTSVEEAAAAFEGSSVLEAALGPELHDAILTVRRAEAERCAALDPVALTSAVRWRW